MRASALGDMGRLLDGNLLLAVFVGLVILLSLTLPHFATWANLSNVLQRNSIIGIVSCGMLLMIILGGFDLSVGAVGAMSSVIAAALIVHGSVAGGIGLLGQTSIGQPASATDWPLTAIAAVVVGGVPLSGGVGEVRSAVLGTLLLGVLGNALNLTGISPFWQPVVTGAVIILAVGFDAYKRRMAQLR
ncbi:hypothetical protein ACELLULO517_21240 [Acidisoma cellulosilytica]|uniref:ABC transporter permease n=1 Tax=Acidisoma cellulosilyticum TaxID=2802395 RepID=A0A963Z4Q2_9PROT|nr:hypothetical protein [Acidisoma cellulosilyticum]MCB8882784.1 hypothetical protein [Acidisoma cellulosilyticum]